MKVAVIQANDGRWLKYRSNVRKFGLSHRQELRTCYANTDDAKLVLAPAMEQLKSRVLALAVFEIEI